MRQVSEAVQDLQRMKFAHLDIRIDNVCFTDDTAVRIDLDRSRPVGGTSVDDLPDYGDSSMNLSRTYQVGAWVLCANRGTN